jgi:hypothetical protein
MSNDRGQTWTLLGDDVHEPALPSDQALWPRGAGYCLKAAPVYQRGQAHPTDCWFSSSDYRRNDCGGGAQMGRAFIVRVSRPDGASAWTAGPVKYFELTDTLTHVHTCQITEYGSPSDPAGLQMIGSLGDSQTRNRFIRWVLPDINLDYSDPASWLSTDNFHGAHADLSSSPAFPGSLSSQPVGAAFGPTPGSIIWGSDTCSDWLSLMQLPLTGPGQASFHHLYGLAASVGAADGTDFGSRLSPFCGSIRDPFPELGGPAVTVFAADGATSNLNNSALIRVLYCPSIGQTPDQWTQVAGVHVGSATTAIYGGRIYYTSEISRFGLWSVPIPQTRTFRPILAAPGGVNLVEGGSYFASGGIGNLEPLQPGTNPGEWVDHGRTVHAPTLSDRVFRIRTDRNSGSNMVAALKQSTTQEHGSAGSWAEPELGWYSGRDRYNRPIDRVRRIRAWMLDATYSDGTPGFGTTPNKTSYLTMSMRAGDVPVNVAYSAVKYSCGDRWCPMTIIGRRSIQTSDPNPGLGVWLDTATTDNNDMYFALDQAMDGVGSIGYPLPPQTPGAGAPIRSPDELLSVTSLGLSCGGDWMLRLAGMQPTGNWDHYSDRGAQDDGQWQSNRRWPLFTLWSDPDTYVEFSADCEQRGYILKFKTSGAPVQTVSFGDGLQVWLPESPLLVALAYDASQHALYAGASLGGDRVRTATIPVAFPNPAAVTFATLQFSGAGGGRYGTRPEVVEYRWFGGEATMAPPPLRNEASLRSVFNDLSFLGGN